MGWDRCFGTTEAKITFEQLAPISYFENKFNLRDQTGWPREIWHRNRKIFCELREADFMYQCPSGWGLEGSIKLGLDLDPSDPKNKGPILHMEKFAWAHITDLGMGKEIQDSVQRLADELAKDCNGSVEYVN